MADGAEMEKSYPHFFDPNLPTRLGCPKEYSSYGVATDLAKQAFQKVCFKDAVITKIEGLRRNCKPVCIWEVYYQKKNEQYDYDNDTNIPPVELPDDAALKQFFQDITKLCFEIGVEVSQKLISKDQDVALVEYFPKGCDCKVIHF